MIKVPPDLQEKVKNGRVVLFVGAGLSKAAGLPSWTNLLTQMIDRVEDSRDPGPQWRKELERLIADGELLDAADELLRQMSDGQFHDFLRQVFRPAQLNTTRTHQLLPQIPFKIVLTTNYDKLLERAYTVGGGDIPSSYTHQNTDEIASWARNEQFHIMHVHGEIDDIRSVILGHNHYRKLIHQNEALKHYITSIFTRYTILFVGYSFSDPDLRLFLDRLHNIFETNTPQHYGLLAGDQITQIQREQYRENYGIQMISYQPSAPDHPEVFEFLSALVTGDLPATARKPAPEKAAPPSLEPPSAEEDGNAFIQNFKNKAQKALLWQLASDVTLSALLDKLVEHWHLPIDRDGHLLAYKLCYREGGEPVDSMVTFAQLDRGRKQQFDLVEIVDDILLSDPQDNIIAFDIQHPDANESLTILTTLEQTSVDGLKESLETFWRLPFEVGDDIVYYLLQFANGKNLDTGKPLAHLIRNDDKLRLAREIGIQVVL